MQEVESFVHICIEIQLDFLLLSGLILVIIVRIPFLFSTALITITGSDGFLNFCGLHRVTNMRTEQLHF